MFSSGSYRKRVCGPGFGVNPRSAKTSRLARRSRSRRSNSVRKRFNSASLVALTSARDAGIAELRVQCGNLAVDRVDGDELVPVRGV